MGILDRISPDESHLPPSARTWARIISIAGGFDVLEMRDPNDGQSSDPASKIRHQYLVMRDVLWHRALPPAPLDSTPAASTIMVGDRNDGWKDAKGVEGVDMDDAAKWHLVAPTSTRRGMFAEASPSSIPWEWAMEHGVRPYPTFPVEVDGGYVMPPRDPWDAWADVTGAPCPADGCDQTLVWHEAGYVPGYRVCMATVRGGYDMNTIRHRWTWAGGVLSDEEKRV